MNMLALEDPVSFPPGPFHPCLRAVRPGFIVQRTCVHFDSFRVVRLTEGEGPGSRFPVLQSTLEHSPVIRRPCENSLLTVRPLLLIHSAAVSRTWSSEKWKVDGETRISREPGKQGEEKGMPTHRLSSP